MYTSRTKGRSMLTKLKRWVVRACRWLWAQTVVMATYEQVRFWKNGKLLYEGPLSEMPPDIRKQHDKFQAEMAAFTKEMTGYDW